MNNTHIVNDEGTFTKYFHVLPNIYDDDLDPYEYRLIGHYKRVGISFEGTRKTAVHVKMSVGQVSKTRKSLVAKNLIRVEMLTRKQLKDRGLVSDKYPNDKREICVVSVIDVMKENIERYQPVEGKPVHGVNIVRSPGEQKNNSIKKTKIKDSAASKKDAESVGKSEAVKSVPERVRNPIFDAVATCIFKTSDPNAKGGRIAKISTWLEGKNEGQEKLGFISKPASAVHVQRFSEWCHDKGITPPHDLTKFVEQWRAWASQVNHIHRPIVDETVVPDDWGVDSFMRKPVLQDGAK